MGAEDRTPQEPLENAADAAAGDYSYDLAHEAAAIGEPVRTADEETGRPHPRAAEAPPLGDDGDYSYDLAHEVPPPRR